MNSITFTIDAARKVRELLLDEGNDNLKLRVFVTGGGCSGFSYGFTFDEEASEDDTAVSRDGVTLLVDPLSIAYLEGARVDFREDLSGTRFVVENPTAATTCGCGNSFSI